MGRVSRYKKVKKSLDQSSGRGSSGGETIWGYTDCGRKPKKRSLTVLRLQARNQKKRRRTSNDKDGFDLEVTGGDEFDLHDLVGSVRKERIPVVAEDETDNKSHVKRNAQLKKETDVNTRNTTKVPSVATNEEITSKSHVLQESKLDDHNPTATKASSSLEGVEEAKLLKSIEKQIEPVPQSGIVSDLGRKPGESKRAYNKRVKLETRLIIQNTRKSARNPEKQQRKKEFLKQKKLKKKKQQPRKEDSSDYQYTSTSKTHSPGPPDPVPFGEQAERPPIFKVLPRGAVPKLPQTNNNKLKATTISSEEMEIIRRKVQAQYNAIKAQRRHASGVNSFHL
jgi:hypothetical protein